MTTRADEMLCAFTMKLSWLVGVVLPAVACGSSSGVGSDGAALPTIDNLVEAVDAADCDVLVRCHEVSDVALCRQYLGPPQTGFNSLAAGVASVKAGKATYDPATAGACLDAIAGSACRVLLTQYRVQPEPCKRIFTGKVADGERCIADAECVAGSFCGASPTGGCDGTCTRAGTLCNNDTHCSAGQVCDQVRRTQQSLGTCAAPVVPGGESQSCGTNLICNAGFHCRLNNDGSSGCARSGQTNDVCDRTIGSCDVGLLCVGADDGSNPRCLPPAAKGQPCQGSDQCAAALSSFACDPTTHTCVDAPTTGPCLGDGLRCNPTTSFCSSASVPSVCTPYQTLGSSCFPTGNPCGLLEACLTSFPTDVMGTCQPKFTQDTCAP